LAQSNESIVTEGGVTYRKTVQTTTYPQIEHRWQEQTQPIVREQVTIENQRSSRLVYRPVIEYQWRPILRNRFNPLAVPYWSYELVPTTRWEAASETVEIPIARRQYVQEGTQTVKVLVPTQRMVEQQVITRVPLDGEAASLARREIGGQRLDGKAIQKGAGNAE
jgi:hypothetical protein